MEIGVEEFRKEEVRKDVNNNTYGLYHVGGS
jgi:hypothetical protein